MGIFAGSGIGNSSLLSMLARHSDADALVLGRSASAAASSPAFFTKGLGPGGSGARRGRGRDLGFARD